MMAPEGKRLLILGGNRYNVLSIRAARRAGFVTLVADRNPEAPGLREADIPLAVDLFDYERLIAAVRANGGVNGVVSMAEAGVRPAAHLAAHFGLPSISEEAASNATSKAAMRRLWADTGFSTDFAVVETEEAAISASDRMTFPLIIKPDRSFGGSRGVSRVESRNQVGSAFRFAFASGLRGTSVLLEPCLEGTEHSCEVLIYEGRSSVLCIGQKVKSPYPYRVDASVLYPADLSAHQQRLVARMCHEAALRLGHTRGVAHVEFALTATGPVLFELGARCGGGHTPQIAHAVSGVDEFVEVCRIAVGGMPKQFRPLFRKGADYHFLVLKPGKVAEVYIPEEVKNHPAILDVGVTVAPGEEILPVRTTSERAGFIVTTGRDALEAAALADWACKKIIIRYADGPSACASSTASIHHLSN